MNYVLTQGATRKNYLYPSVNNVLTQGITKLSNVYSSVNNILTQEYIIKCRKF